MALKTNSGIPQIWQDIYNTACAKPKRSAFVKGAAALGTLLAVGAAVKICTHAVKTAQNARKNPRQP